MKPWPLKPAATQTPSRTRPRIALQRLSVAGREHAPVGELLRREPALGRDDERLEQPLTDRVAEAEDARLRVDRQLGQEPRRVDAGRDDDVAGVEVVERLHLAEPHVR